MIMYKDFETYWETDGVWYGIVKRKNRMHFCKLEGLSEQDKGRENKRKNLVQIVWHDDEVGIDVLPEDTRKSVLLKDEAWKNHNNMQKI